MMHYNPRIQHFNSRLCQWRNLLFFLLLMIAGCKTENKNDVTVTWEKEKATAVQIPSEWINGIPKDSVRQSLKISRLDDKEAAAILGEFRFGKEIIFEPLIPFSRGTDYAIYVKNKKVAQFNVPFADKNDPPEIIATYPQQDTVPENLLKIYIQFSHPMSEGQSAKYISLIKNNSDTLHDVFLDLQPELWNEDRTAITVWLDPGRIKRDLQPNLKLGAPLHQKEKYELIVSKEWKDAQGRSLQKEHNWFFTTDPRDSLSPDPARWKIHLPKATSREPLLIDLSEPLDHFLLMESISITGKNGASIKAIFETKNKDNTLTFTPADPWVAGNYTLHIKSKLEDLAGNNINRPFDRDVTKSREPSTKEYYTKNFIIEK